MHCGQIGKRLNPTGLDVLRRALPGLRILLENANRALNQVNDEDSYSAYEFSNALHRLYLATTLAVEAAGLPEMCRHLADRWRHATAQGMGRLQMLFGDVHSAEFSLLHDFLEGLKAVVGQGLDPVDAYNLKRFEQLLRDTAVFMHRRGVQPKNEADIQKVMDELLYAAFIDYSPQVPIAGIIKNFKPDGGVRSIKAAVEFKFVRSPQEMRGAVSGILEDTAGYRGSADWVRFYSVIYMTGPYESEARFDEELRRAEAPAWTPILVNGAASKQSVRKNRPQRARKERTPGS